MVSSEDLAKMANGAVDTMSKYLFMQGYYNLQPVDKATLLKTIGRALEKTAWHILNKENTNENKV